MSPSSLSPQTLSPDAGRKVVPKIKRAGEQALPLIGWSILESRSCTSPEQHNRTDPVGRGTAKLTLRL